MKAVLQNDRGQPRATLRRVTLAIGAVLAVGLLGSGLRYAYWGVFEHRAAEVAEGRLFQSAEMPAEELKAFVLKHGIRSVFDLRAPDEGDLKPQAERSILEELGVTYFLPGVDPLVDPRSFDEFILAAAEPSNLPMLVHCHHGTGRSVLATAIYRIEFEGWDNERARKASKLFSFRGAFGPGGQKGLYLHGYKPHLDSLLTEQQAGGADSGSSADPRDR